MNIFNKIKTDHQEARDIMDNIIKTRDNDERFELFQQLKVAILSHAKSEEKTFYKALNVNRELKDETPHLKHEHKDAENIFHEIDKEKLNSPEWWEKFGEVRKALLHHMEEEEKEIFPEARKEIDAERAKELGEEMEELQEAIKPEIQEKQDKAA